ncbi:hypothetical protein ACQ4M3_19040 [Leptolyngbya sp. AN03gr2]|uniref:hypothetical protein n=1 Tax=Leptolyngbya sp. AN03gr2 TaxID=3423364 RepID=UPI003D310655
MATFHLTSTDYPSGESYALIQGATYDYVVFWYPEDLTGFVPRGQIRTNYLQKEGELVVSFQFHPVIYEQRTLNEVTGFYSKIHPYLTARQTELINFDLRKRKSLSEEVKPGRNVWVYDIELERLSDQYVIKVAKGWVEVELEVTGND